MRAAADEVLSRPEFRPPSRPVVERVFEWLLRQFGRLLDALTGGGQASLVAWLVLGVSLGVVTVMVARFVRGVSAGPSRPRSGRGERRRTAADWRAEAEAAAAGGRWRAAVRAQWRALVADLAERGLLEEVPGRTAGEYRAGVRRDLPGVAPEFAVATGVFEAVWYGSRPAVRADLEEVRQASGSVLAALDRPAAALA